MQTIAMEQHPTRSDLMAVQDKIAVVNSEIEQLVQRRLASSTPQEDKLAPFRQQAAVIRRNKDASAARADELAASLREYEATLADLQSQVCHVASSMPQDKLEPFRQQEAVIRRKKDASATRAV